MSSNPQRAGTSPLAGVVTEQEFVAGVRKTYDDPEKTNFVFSDDVWWPLDRLKADGVKADARIDFSRLPEWLKDAAKQYVAYRWLTLGRSTSGLHGTMSCFRYWAAALGTGEDPFEGSIHELTRSHGCRVARYLEQRAQAGQAALEALPEDKGLIHRERRRAIAEAGGLNPGIALRYCQEINQVAAWLRRMPEGINTDFLVEISANFVEMGRRRRDVTSADASNVVSTSVLKALLQAVEADREEFRLATERWKWVKAQDGRGRTKAWLHTVAAARARWIMAFNRCVAGEALRLQLVTARRRGAVAVMPLKPQTRIVDLDEGKKLVNVLFPAYKLHGDQGIEEWVPCPDYFGEVALDAIRHTQRLTATIREKAPLKLQERLFLVLNIRGTPVPFAGRHLQRYLTCNDPNALGLVQRYQIRGAEALTSHKFRHTHATRMVEAGAPVILAARYLGHLVTSNNPLMTKLFYIAGGTPGMRQRMMHEMEAGAARGLSFDSIARVAIRKAGIEHVATPPNELSYEEAMQRIRAAHIVDEDGPDEAVVRALLGDGWVIHVTAYGGCMLRATSGPCPTSEKCPVGLFPEAPATHAGEGCPHQVLMPHALERLYEDVALMEAQVEWYREKPEYAFWLARVERNLMIWRTQIGRAEAMLASMQERSPTALPKASERHAR